MQGDRAQDTQRLGDTEPLRSQILGSEVATLEDDGDGGTIQISENVIAAVVRKYTLAVDGVVRFAGGGLVGGIAGMLTKRSYDTSMVIDMDEDTVSVSVTLVLRFGVRIPEVAQTVQDVIRRRVEELTGKQVARVNVLVYDLEDVEKPPRPENSGQG